MFDEITVRDLIRVESVGDVKIIACWRRELVL